jgi:hypothetical protein
MRTSHACMDWMCISMSWWRACMLPHHACMLAELSSEASAAQRAWPALAQAMPFACGCERRLHGRQLCLCRQAAWQAA